MRMLPDDECLWIVGGLMWLAASFPNFQSCNVHTKFYFTEQEELFAPEMEVTLWSKRCPWSMSFWFEDIAAEDSPTPNFHVVSAHLYFSNGEAETDTFDVTSVMMHLGRLSTLRVIVLSCNTKKGVLAAMKRHRPMLFIDHMHGDRRCIAVFLCRSSEIEALVRAQRTGLKTWCYVALDPITLHSTGEAWNDHNEIVPSTVLESLRASP
ncbi:hypothetical protein BDY19DRAFT_996274 [Irpex rosettiformis]|uniref:Uncharacterized protein n=1 Tax=Irpex rosettiformis TaxID=378272 RepID=A0ACB8TVL2_9APHY|nr:hypothetical protein BDY19DRAFT_996274 [Irpex rosettiformis]